VLNAKLLRFWQQQLAVNIETETWSVLLPVCWQLYDVSLPNLNLIVDEDNDYEEREPEVALYL